MPIDWSLFSKIAGTTGTLVLGAIINHYIERRPKLITYYGHISAFRLRVPEQPEVYTHSIVIRNAGRKAATNVAIGHNVFPRDYQIYPHIAHEVRKVPDAGDEIYIATLVPGEQITISYLYTPPLTFNYINTYVKSDDGFARVLNVIPTPQAPKWLLTFIWALVIIGAAAVIYILISAGLHVYALSTKA